MTYRPWYNKDTDYQTNAKSYMDYLGRVNHFLKLVIEDYEIFQEMIRMELKNTKFRAEQSVADILKNWLRDGTLERIINDEVFGNKADKDSVYTKQEVDNQLLEKTNKQEVEQALQVLEDSIIEGLEELETKILANVSSIEEQGNQLTNHANEINRLDKLLKEPEMYVELPMQTTPAKMGLKTTTPKIVFKRGDQFYNVIQKTTNCYLVYDLKAGIGSSTTSDTGTHFETYRITKVQTADNVYLFNDDHKNVTGTLSTLQDGTRSPNNSETKLFNLNLIDLASDDIFGSKPSGHGLAMYSLTGTDSSVDYELISGSKQTANVLLGGSPGSTSEVDIVVNGEVVQTVYPNQWSSSTEMGYRVITFPIPTGDMGAGYPVTITLVNKDGTNPMYFSCLNFVPLKKYDGEQINHFKVFSEPLFFINHTGASDYAFLDQKNNRWIGSYHGGETLRNAVMTWNRTLNKQFDRDNRNGRISPNNSEIGTGDFIVTTNFMMNQQSLLTTVTGETALLNSYLDFNTDGTVDAWYSLKDNKIVFKTLYTMLNCTHPSLNFITYPDVFRLTETNSEHEIKLSEGIIAQRSESGKLEMINRFTRYPNTHNHKEHAFVQNHPSLYRKLYYAPIIHNEENIIVTDLTFSRGIDFNRY